MRKLSVPWASVSGEWVEALAQSSLATDPLELARHKAFILSRLIVAASVLLATPLWIVLNGAPTLRESAIFALAQIPLLSVVALLRFKNLRLAQSISIFGWFALAAACGALARDYHAVAALLLAVASIEAALTFELAMVAAIVAMSFGVLALDAGFHTAGAADIYEPFGSARAAALGALLLAYIAILAVGAIFASSRRAHSSMSAMYAIGACSPRRSAISSSASTTAALSVHSWATCTGLTGWTRATSSGAGSSSAFTSPIARLSSSSCPTPSPRTLPRRRC